MADFIPKPSKLQPALMGGLIVGLGSSIPVVNYANLCCCLWVLVGAVVAARMLIRRSPMAPVTTGEGAVVGLLAGLVGTVVNLVISVPLYLLSWHSVIERSRQMADSYSDPLSRVTASEWIGIMEDHPMLFALLFWLLFSFVAIGAATIGGVIGVALLEKRKGQPPPPPPQPPLSIDFNPPGNS